ncbi:unnamed protein product, partial [Mycena citricolor]
APDHIFHDSPHAIFSLKMGPAEPKGFSQREEDDPRVQPAKGAQRIDEQDMHRSWGPTVGMPAMPGPTAPTAPTQPRPSIPQRENLQLGTLSQHPVHGRRHPAPRRDGPAPLKRQIERDVLQCGREVAPAPALPVLPDVRRGEMRQAGEQRATGGPRISGVCVYRAVPDRYSAGPDRASQSLGQRERADGAAGWRGEEPRCERVDSGADSSYTRCVAREHVE